MQSFSQCGIELHCKQTVEGGTNGISQPLCPARAPPIYQLADR